MSEELSTMVQIIELYGKGIGVLGKAIQLSAHGAKHGADFIKLKEMQTKMKLHYASTGTHDTMTLSDLEKLTGGQYDILNIPIEDEKTLLGFYDQLKKLKVSFAELPDLDLGDGYTQIAFNPQDASLVKTVSSLYKDKMEKEAAVISLEQYEKMGGEKGQQVLEELATKGYEKETHMAHLENIRDRNDSKEYLPISLNIESLLLDEKQDRYLCRIPGSVNKDRTALAMYIKKEDVLILDKGQTIFTHLKQGDTQKILKLDSKWEPTGEVVLQSTDEVVKYFNRISAEKEKVQANRVRLDQTECLPNFNYGQNPKKETKTETAQVKDGESKDVSSAQTLTKSQEMIKEVVQKESLKEKATKKEYFPISMDFKESLISETKYLYMLQVPGSADRENNTLSYIVINKKNASLSKDGKTLTAFLNKKESTKVHERNVSSGKSVNVREIKNEELAKKYSSDINKMKEQINVKSISEHDLLIGEKTLALGKDKVRK